MPAPITRPAVGLIMGLMERARGRDANDTVLRHPITTLLLGIVWLGIVGMGIILSITNPSDPAPRVCQNCGRQIHPELTIFLVFSVLFVLLVYVIYRQVREEYTIKYMLYGSAGAIALAALAALCPGDGGLFWIPLLTLIGVWIIWDYFKERHQIEPDGLRYRTFSAGSGMLRWSEVEQVHYNQKAGWFRLVTRQGEIVRVSVMLIGLPAFARAVLAGVPGTSIDKDTRQVLEQTALGILPPLPRSGH